MRNPKSKRWVSSFKRLAERFQMGRDEILEWMKEGMPVERDKKGKVKIDTDAVKMWAKEKKGVEVKDPPENRNAVIQSLVELGMPKREVGRMLNLGPSQVYNVLNQFEADKPFIDKFRENRTKIFTLNQLKRQALQDRILDTIKDEDITSESMYKRVVAVKELGVDKHREFEMERIEEGKSTDNVAMIMKHIYEIKEEEDKEEEDRSIT